MDFETCWACGGEGVDGHDCGDDSCCCAFPEDNLTCAVCDGEGSWPVCMSSAEWCEANPRPGRENVKRDTPEWYAMENEREPS